MADQKFAILIPGSATAGFYSQIATISLALKQQRWNLWKPRIYAYLGPRLGPDSGSLWERWAPYLRDVEFAYASEGQFAEMDNWAQCDAMISMAPRDADVVLTLDADTLPVQNFESVLDRVFSENLVAGVIAHYPVPPATTPRRDWSEWSSELLTKPLEFAFSHSLVCPDEAEERRSTPFYVNAGVIFYARQAFNSFAPRYLDYRSKLMARMEDNGFAGQVAFTLACTECGLSPWSLPMRYNMPNDDLAEKLHPHEVDHAVIFHYLRTTEFDRQEIFTSREAYQKFLDMNLTGINRRFQAAVRQVFGDEFPFPEVLQA